MYTYTIRTLDVDANNVVTITAPTIPSWLTLSATTTKGTLRINTLSGTPSSADVGTHNVTIRATDGTETATQGTAIGDIQITVSMQWIGKCLFRFQLIHRL